MTFVESELALLRDPRLAATATSPWPAWLWSADGSRVLGVIHLKDIIKEGIRERFARVRAMGMRTVMITGDNPLTAASIAAENRNRSWRKSGRLSAKACAKST